MNQLLATIDRLHRTQLAAIENSYRQIEGLLALHSVIRFRAPPPPFRGWAIGPDFAVVLWEIIQNHCPSIVVELGGGVSTVIAGYALEAVGAGRIISIDEDAGQTAKTEKLLARPRLTSVAEVRVAPLREMEAAGRVTLWYDLAGFVDLDDIDLLIVDGPAQHGRVTPQIRFPAAPLLYNRLARNAIILVDDANRSHERAMVAEWLNRLPLIEVQRFPTETGAVLLQARRESLPS